MEVHLVDRKWLATDTIPIAGVAGYGYIPHVPEGGVDLASYPYIRAWLVRIYAQPKIVSIATSPIPELVRSK
ncbi:hypothetical protein [Tateyamaria sp. SN3-11]|uniref:hypothetical protein n=1 Tax=Tateyamaria sp. SN3-11 TaxID=3092147 RepID=UPI0039EA9193